MANGSYFRLDENNKIKYTYSHNDGDIDMTQGINICRSEMKRDDVGLGLIH